MTDHYIEAGMEGFRGPILDELLALGYFRMFDKLFTTNNTPEEPYDDTVILSNVFWLRTLVKKVTDSRSARIIRRKCWSFTTTIKRAEITDEVKALYALYCNHVRFELQDNYYEYVNFQSTEYPFDSYMVEVRDESTLIAAGFFDAGTKAIMGIQNIYHPNYIKYSLGKLLMILKMDYARKQEMDYYYTGYISTSKTVFDYKLFPDINAVEVFLPMHKEWKPYNLYTKTTLDEYFQVNFIDILFD